MVCVLLSLINIGSTTALNAILALDLASLLCSYTICILCLVFKRLRGEVLPPAQWSLGRWGTYRAVITRCLMYADLEVCRNDHQRRRTLLASANLHLHALPECHADKCSIDELGLSTVWICSLVRGRLPFCHREEGLHLTKGETEARPAAGDEVTSSGFLRPHFRKA